MHHIRNEIYPLKIAFIAVWLAVSSELGTLRNTYGPSILLWLNVAYYAPSLPLLLLSSLTDRLLEERYGVARVCLTRLVVGLGGYLLLCLW